MAFVVSVGVLGGVVASSGLGGGLSLVGHCSTHCTICDRCTPCSRCHWVVGMPSDLGGNSLWGCLRVASLLAMVLVAPWKWCWVGSVPSLPSWVGSRPSSSSLEPGVLPGSLLVPSLFLLAPLPWVFLALASVLSSALHLPGSFSTALVVSLLWFLGLVGFFPVVSWL